jgi:hypothetical protein
MSKYLDELQQCIDPQDNDKILIFDVSEGSQENRSKFSLRSHFLSHLHTGVYSEVSHTHSGFEEELSNQRSVNIGDAVAASSQCNLYFFSDALGNPYAARLFASPGFQSWFTIYNTGQPVWIESLSPSTSYSIQLNNNPAGNGLATGWLTYSCSVHNKKERVPISAPVEKVRSLRGETFVWNDPDFPEKNNIPDTGIYLEDLEALGLPGLTEECQVKDKPGRTFKAMNTTKLIPVLIEAVKELTTRIEALENTKQRG